MGLAGFYLFSPFKNQNKNQDLASLIDLTSQDSDHDGLFDRKEEELGTNLYSSDTDSDGFSDAEEVKAGHDPLKIESGDLLDEDGDGLSGEDEKKYGTNPKNADSDYDGYSDGQEIASGNDPNKTNLSALSNLVSRNEAAAAKIESVEKILDAKNPSDLGASLSSLTLDSEKRNYDFSINFPEIKESEINIRQGGGKQLIQAYINALALALAKSMPFSLESRESIENYFLVFDAGDPKAAKKIYSALDDFSKTIISLEVPNDPQVIAFHKKFLSYVLAARDLGLKLESAQGDIFGLQEFFKQVVFLENYFFDELLPLLEEMRDKRQINLPDFDFFRKISKSLER